jgi:2-keto-4-pentenoate hydratase/2-oxohepta-3-ene-1,7-dioic acid hydratase in catechol pathway
VTTDELQDPQNLKIQCRVNGQVMQESHTGMMIFPVARLVNFLSMHFTLLPGDIILTGTPHGVGAFRKPAVYLKTGDKIEVEIERIGCLSNVCESKP